MAKDTIGTWTTIFSGSVSQDIFVRKTYKWNYPWQSLHICKHSTQNFYYHKKSVIVTPTLAKIIKVKEKKNIGAPTPFIIVPTVGVTIIGGKKT